MPRPLDAPLDVQRPVAGRGQCLAPGSRDTFFERVLAVHGHHALAAAAGRGLQDQWKADLPRRRGDSGVRLVLGLAARHDPDARVPGRAPRVDLRAEAGDHVRPWADEGQPRLGARRRQGGVLGEKAVAWMHRVGAARAGGFDDAADRQVALGRRGRPDAQGRVGRDDMTRVAIGVREDRGGGYAECAAGPCDADRDLAAVGNQDAREHGRYIRNTP